MPKSLYRSVEFGEGDEFSLGHEIYQPAYVSKVSPHEVRLCFPGDMIMTDFLDHIRQHHCTLQ